VLIGCVYETTISVDKDVRKKKVTRSLPQLSREKKLKLPLTEITRRKRLSNGVKKKKTVGEPTDFRTFKTADPAESKKGKENHCAARVDLGPAERWGRQTTKVPTKGETSDTVNDFMTSAGNYEVLILGCKHPASVAHHGSSSFM
jgi:hypothetical protein